MMKTEKTEFIQVKVTEQDKAALAEMSQKSDRPMSQIVREALREKVADFQKESEEAKPVGASA